DLEATVPPFKALPTSLLRSERVTQTHHVARGLVDHAHELILRTRAPAGVLAGDVDGFSRHRQVVGQLVAHGQVDLVVCFDEVRVAVIAVLVGGQQVLVTPVPGQTRRPAVLLVHQHAVGGVAQAGQGTPVRTRIGGTVPAHVTLHDGVVGLDAEATVRAEVLATDFPAAQLGRTLVARAIDV